MNTTSYLLNNKYHRKKTEKIFNCREKPPREQFWSCICKLLCKLLPIILRFPTQWSFPYIEGKFSDFTELRESNKSLRHVLGSIQRFCMLPFPCRRCDISRPQTKFGASLYFHKYLSFCSLEGLASEHASQVIWPGEVCA